jgi:hypothetical protein
MVAGGIIASQIRDDTGGNGPTGIVVTATSTAMTGSQPSTSGTQGGAPADQTADATAGSTGEQPTGSTDTAPTTAAGNGQVANVLQAKAPVRGAPINGIQFVEDYYSEQYTFDNFTIGWRPGAFPAERANQVAEQARRALDEVNQKLGTNDHGEIEILLADQMYLEEDCHGCQGYAFSDFRQVYILQDGSMAEDEFQALLTHEIGHVIAGSNIALPHVATLFMAEGLATWLMTPALVEQGYIEPRQIAAWALKAGILPPIWQLRKADFEGRTGARLEYDPAASFTQFMIETYGMADYKRIYAAELPDDVVGKTWEQLEQEWHDWLAEWADNSVGAATATSWWNASALVKQGFDRLYADETTVTQEQYAELATARVVLNKGDVVQAVTLMQASGLVPGTAN